MRDLFPSSVIINIFTKVLQINALHNTYISILIASYNTLFYHNIYCLYRRQTVMSDAVAAVIVILDIYYSRGIVGRQQS